MRFRGGGIGHKATWDWNEVLFQDTGKAVEHDGDDTQMNETSEEQEDDKEGDKEVEWMGIMEPDNDSDEGGDEDEESEDSDDDEADRVVADEGEELDEDIFAREGYDAL